MFPLGDVVACERHRVAPFGELHLEYEMIPVAEATASTSQSGMLTRIASSAKLRSKARFSAQL